VRITKIISIIFHPSFMPLIIVYLSLKLIPNIGFAITNYLPFIYGILFTGTILLPLTSVFILLKIGHISSLEIHKRKERPMPLLLASIWFACAYYILQEILLFAPILNSILIGSIIIVFCSSIISAFWKISLHMLGVGGGVGVLFSLNFLFGGLSSVIIIALFICGILGIARNLEKAHNHSQIYAGFILGFLLECISILLL